MLSMAYGYMGNDGKYVVTYKIFIVIVHSVKKRKREQCDMEVLLQETVLSYRN